MKKILVLIVCFIQFSIYAQKMYSEKAITGRGGLELIGNENKLQKEVFDAFKKMQKAALQDGIDIKIVSAYRSFDRQKSIWNRKYTKYTKAGLKPNEAIEKIIEYSTMPGTSRHHWGTDIDVIEGGKKRIESVLQEKNFDEGEIYSDLKKWMDKNANYFGFYLVYTNTKGRKGFKYEPWHYSYKPISKKMLEVYLKSNVLDSLKLEKINGIENVSSNFFEKYLNEQILDINPELFK